MKTSTHIETSQTNSNLCLLKKMITKSLFFDGRMSWGNSFEKWVQKLEKPKFHKKLCYSEMGMGVNELVWDDPKEWNFFKGYHAWQISKSYKKYFQFFYFWEKSESRPKFRRGRFILRFWDEGVQTHHRLLIKIEKILKEAGGLGPWAFVHKKVSWYPIDPP